MKNLIIILCLFSLTAFSQSEKIKFQLNKAEGEASVNDFKNADSTFAKLEREFPDDSLVLVKKAKYNWSYGRVKQNINMVNQAIRLYTVLGEKYPNSDFKLYLATAHAKRCEIAYYDLKNLQKDKSTLLPEFEKAKNEIEANLSLAKSDYITSVANKDLKSCEATINRIKYN